MLPAWNTGYGLPTPRGGGRGGGVLSLVTSPGSEHDVSVSHLKESEGASHDVGKVWQGSQRAPSWPCPLCCFLLPSSASLFVWKPLLPATLPLALCTLWPPSENQGRRWPPLGGGGEQRDSPAPVQGSADAAAGLGCSPPFLSVPARIDLERVLQWALVWLEPLHGGLLQGQRCVMAGEPGCRLLCAFPAFHFTLG